MEPATTECRGAAGSCDPAEFCDGASTACPADALEPSTTECRGAAGSWAFWPTNGREYVKLASRTLRRGIILALERPTPAILRIAEGMEKYIDF